MTNPRKRFTQCMGDRVGGFNVLPLSLNNLSDFLGVKNGDLQLEQCVYFVSFTRYSARMV